MSDEGEFYSLKVTSVERETPDAVSLTLEVPTHLAQRFVYRAGQFVTVMAKFTEPPMRRCYSLSTAPETDSVMRITVKQVRDGRVSDWLNNRITPGDTIDVSPPGGRFCLRGRGSRLSLIGAGSGITPLMSLAKSALASTGRFVTLIYANRDRQSVIFAQQLAELEQRYPERFAIFQWLDHERGLVTAEQLLELNLLGADDDYYICGPEPFIRLAESAARTAGAGPVNMFVERFIFTPDEIGAQGAASISDEMCETVTITCRKQKREGEYHRGDTILEAARRLGLQPVSSCHVGTCASCMARVVKGSVRMRTNAALTAGEVEDGYILACQSLPTTRYVNVAFED